jgi:nonsense-mediated mRNA decay protein 3
MSMLKHHQQQQQQIESSSSAMMVNILCCMCGVPIVQPPNTSGGSNSNINNNNNNNTCASCLASTCDITRGISTEVTIHQCRGCQRWHKDSNKWLVCELESRELMTLCLQHVNGLKNNKTNRVHLTDASWIWTEPHSMRLKIRLTIQREVQQGIILQQSFTVEFIVRNQQCVECQAEFRQGSWKSLVQVRQRVQHKRTFLYLEQLILKQGAHRGALNIVTFRDGMDFYFPDKGKAARFMAFLDSVVPIKIKQSKKLISTDDKNNLTNFKYTNYVEICPLCKDDLLFLSHKTARQLGSISRIVLVKNVSNVIHVIDPLSGQTGSLTCDAYWRDPIRPLITAARSRMGRYIVLGQEPVLLRKNIAQRSTNKKQRHKLAQLTLANENDLGINDVQVEVLSHQGYLFKAGDMCVGYNLKEIQLMDDEAEQLRMDSKLPDVIVGRKLYGPATGSEAASKARMWKLQRLNVKVGEESTKRGASKNNDEDDMDEEDFMQEVEADKDMRLSMNLYKSDVIKKKKTDDLESGMQDDREQVFDEDEDNGDDDDDDDDDDDQKINLDELLDELNLDDGPDEIDEDEDDDINVPNKLVRSFPEGETAARDGITYVDRDAARTIRDKESAVPVSGLGKEFVFK